MILGPKIHEIERQKIIPGSLLERSWSLLGPKSPPGAKRRCKSQVLAHPGAPKLEPKRSPNWSKINKKLNKKYIIFNWFLIGFGVDFVSILEPSQVPTSIQNGSEIDPKCNKTANGPNLQNVHGAQARASFWGFRGRQVESKICNKLHEKAVQKVIQFLTHLMTNF